MTQVSQLERRQVPRYAVRLPVLVAACDGTITGVRGHTVDISMRGMRVVTDADLRHGVDQTVMMDVSGSPIVVRAEIVRTERRGDQWVHGLLLTEMEDTEEDRLRELCVERS